jgi:3-dehydroquinate dehydratase II
VPDPKRILIVNGPNLNKLGTREPELYGSLTLDEIAALCESRAKGLGLSIDFRQSNSEGEIVEWLQDAPGAFDAIVINPAAYTHTSVAIHDALRIAACPVVEVHLSNIYQRESWRHTSYVSPVATGMICGLGARGYLLALDALAGILDEGKAE